MMAKLRNGDDKVTLEECQDKKAQAVKSYSRFITSTPITERSDFGKEYISFIVAVIFTIIIFLVVVVLQIVLLGGDELCSTRALNNKPTDILRNLNRDVDPCDNFYEFACGGWENNNPIPEGDDEWRTWTKQDKLLDAMATELMLDEDDHRQNIAIKQAKLMYQKCMELEHQNIDGKESVLKFFKETLEFYGGWPIISVGDEWNPRNFNWMKSWVGLKQRFDIPVILDVNSYRDVDNAVGKNFINISKPLPELADLSIFLPSNSYIVDLSKQLMDSKDNPKFNETSLHEQADRIKIVHGELIELKRLNLSTVMEFRKRHGFTENFCFMTIRGLQEILDDMNVSGNTINVLELVKLLYEKSGVENTGDTILYINDISYLLNVQQYIASLDKTDLANYLHFKMVHDMIELTTKESRGLYYDGVFRPEGNQRKLMEAECIAGVRTRLNFVMESKLIEKEYGSATCFKRSRDETSRMFELLKKVFRDSKYTSRLLHGNSNTKICIAFPDWIFDDNRLQMEYSGLNLSLPTFLQQTLAFNEWETIKHQKTPILPLGINDCDYSFMEDHVAVALLELHQIYLNWKMLMPPFFAIGDHNKPQNFGAIGTILAHELSHILDRHVLLNYTLDSNMTHDEDCLVKQYENLSQNISQSPEKSLYGVNTLRENVADNAALQLAYMAFKADEKLDGNYKMESNNPRDADYFTDDQKFFIGYAQNWCHTYSKLGMEAALKDDEHSLGRFRVLGTLQNSVEFSRAWNCPVGSYMNPDPQEHKKCIFVSDQTSSKPM